MPAVGLDVFSAYGTLKNGSLLIRYHFQPIKRLLTWVLGPSEGFHRSMFRRQVLLRQMRLQIDLSSRMEYFSICNDRWYKVQQWLRDWDDHQKDWPHWKYQLRHQMRMRDKDPNNYLFPRQIVRHHLGIACEGDFYNQFSLKNSIIKHFIENVL